jgi:chloramphenicol-sensitive protein RarD
MWGFLPIYIKLLDHVSALEFVAHRIVWSFPFLAILLWRWGLWGHLGAALVRGRTMLLLAATAALIFINWLVFVYANFTDQVLQGSLGYFINPLVVVALGCLVFSERLRRLQIISLCFAAAGVLVQVIALGTVPWIALSLAFSFAFYGLLRKITHVGAIEGLAVETLLLSPPAILYVAWLWTQEQSAFLRVDLGTDLLLMGAGPLTVVPLLLFTVAARRLPFSTIGFLQYIGPSLQFICAVFLFGEVFGGVRLASFALIWIALVLFSMDAMRRRAPV